MSNIESLYEAYRTPLFSFAYRMLGSVMDAEDIVQEAFIAYEQVPDVSEIRNERAFLYKIVTNRCLDLLRSSAKKRELYVGPWLPEPLIGLADAEDDPSTAYLRRESISMAYLLLLQQLNAVERAIFLLREIFGYSYEEIAETIGRSAANCRQIYHRAKKGIHYDPDRTPSVSVAENYVREFANALVQGNMNRMLELVSDDVAFISDGGGKVRAAGIPVYGADRVIALLQGLLRMYEGQFSFSFLPVNGQPGMRFVLNDEIQYVYTFHIEEDRIRAMYVVCNPDKLRHV
ncbi:RNA polymerase sigma factor SigJ [Cohnella xylanilytica]|uniref:RNA polymerase sigma-70 factor n=1 Tax=Cohnella xylanilytica TaxID=557555 RepID=UPI001B0A69D8|nr:RNA polymerase sigma-70 factor [Cohnella xylanilytica]GIO13654.1 RNA polymerase sigma factor SigJ [Cohnella xylanilytica]